ncbi:MAG: twin-arginine translocase TatA/TatE family subunit [Ignavibacteria bacterium]
MIDGWEWIVIGVVAIVIIMWGPSKIPEFAKALGKAKGEFGKAQKEFTAAAIAEPAVQPVQTSFVSSAAPQPTVIKTKDEILLETAQKLGISTTGKTREEISKEINVKVNILSSD